MSSIDNIGEAVLDLHLDLKELRDEVQFAPKAYREEIRSLILRKEQQLAALYKRQQGISASH